MLRAWLVGVGVAGLLAGRAPAVQAQTGADLGPLPGDGTAVVVQGRVTRVQRDGDSTTIVLQMQPAEGRRVTWDVVTFTGPYYEALLRADSCWRFTGVLDGGTMAYATTPLLNLSYTMGAARIAATAAEPVMYNRNTVTGCDRPREGGNPATRFDPNTMGPAGTVPDEAPPPP